MRQMPQLLPATAANTACLHNSSDQQKGCADRHDEAFVYFALGDVEPDSLPLGEEGNPVVPVLHIFDICMSGNEGVGHGNWFREDGIRKHFELPPHCWAVASCCVPTASSKRRRGVDASYKTEGNRFVNRYAFQSINPVHERPSVHLKSACQVAPDGCSPLAARGADKAAAPNTTPTRVPPRADGGQPYPSPAVAGAKSDGPLSAIVGRGGSEPGIHIGQAGHQEGSAAWAGNEAGVASGPAAINFAGVSHAHRH